MKELKFYSPDEYLQYDFDDSYCFFFSELKEYGEKEIHEEPALIDYEQRFRKIITGLFKIYDALIIVPEEELLLGLIGDTRILIKKSPIEE